MDMSEWDDLSDDQLMAALAEAVAEGGTDRRRSAAQAAFTWRTVDAELAELLHDSALDAGAAVRSGEEGPRALAFGRDGLTLEVEVDGDDVLGEVIAEATADGPASVTLQRPDAVDVVVTADAAGFFRFSAVGPGPLRFVVYRSSQTLTTPWITR